MPTAISIARHCLADDSAAALDSAVAAARRRSHTQTTSLHLIFALLSSSSSSSSTPSLLRDAVSRAARSSRLQFKALDLCFSVALDRLPSSHHHHNHKIQSCSSDDEPPVSNSLMAAIKRSQAHQRRNPDTFHLYSQANSASSSSPPFAGVRVELQQLVLAILDDPVVSRVFGEAGFRSCDIKIAVLRPFPRLPARCPPLFLGNFSSGDAPLRGFPFPLPVQQPGSDCGHENCRRVGEILARRSGRNPVLVGVGAADAARDFADAVKRRNWSVLPPELQGLKFGTIGRDGVLDIAKRLEELGQDAEAPGVVVSIGDLKELVEGDGRCEEGTNCLVTELTKALQNYHGRLWVMGWSATYEAYMKFLSRYPLLDKEWDLQLLPITSLRPAMGGLLPRTQSMMESFVPFGGFFPAAYEPKGLLSNSCQSAGRCQHCNDNYEQEVAAILREYSSSVEDQHLTNMPAWLRKADVVSMNDELDSTKAKDDRSILSAKVKDLQKKWNDNCQRLHRGCQIPETDNFQMLSHVGGFPYVSDKERGSNPISKNPDITQRQSGANPLAIAVGLHITKASQSISFPVVSEPEDKDLISKLQLRLSKSEQLRTEGFGCQQGALSELGIQGGITSPSSVTSVTTDLVLGTPYRTPRKEEKSCSVTHMERLEDLSECLPSKVNEFSTSVPCLPSRDSLLKDKYLPMQTLLDLKERSGSVSAYAPRYLSSSIMRKPFDPSNFKMFYTSLVEKVGRQEEALRAISEAIVRCRAGHERRHGARLRGDIWLSFLGHDRIGKKKAAMALAELIFGNRENFICIDLGYQDGVCHPNTICNQQEINEYEVGFRGKTIIDYIAEEVSKNPWSVVFLENLNKADFLVQTSLSQAIHTGKLSNSHGREFSINNAIFVTTVYSPGKECVNFSEENILGAQKSQMKILLESIPEASGSNPSVNVSITLRQEPWNRQRPTVSASTNKRKLYASDDNREQHESLGTPKRAHRSSNTFLDLNLTVEEAAASDADYSSGDESNSISGNSEAWVEEFFSLMDETVHFRNFDFDALADHVLKEISKRSLEVIGCECMLEVDVKVMEQILAATWLLEDRGELNDWLEKVFDRSLMELRRRYNLSSRTVMKLVACEGTPMDRAPGILLPSRIVVE